MTYETACAIDLFVVLLCSGLLLRSGRLTFAHPATTYFIFHLFTFTTRVWALIAGSPTLFSDLGPSFLPMQEEEIVRAVMLADAALFTVCMVWLSFKRTSDGPSAETRMMANPLNRKLVWVVVALAMPLGIWGLLTQLSVHGSTVAGDPSANLMDESGYLLILPTWPGLCLLALNYVYGFRWWIVAPMAGYIAMVGSQGYHRFRAIIPLIMMLQVWLMRKNLRWPPWPLMVVLFCASLIFFPLKVVGKMAQDGASVGEIADRSGEIITDVFRGNAEDHRFLDEFACALSLVDNAKRYYWGQPYAALLALPIPRKYWPEKPAVNEYILDFSRPWRPMAESGMIVTWLGEAYANFGYLGVVAIPVFLAFLLGKAYRLASRLPKGSMGYFAYLLLSCNLIQVYRDGLTSIVFFVFVHMMPLAILVSLQWVVETFVRANSLPAATAGGKAQ